MPYCVDVAHCKIWQSTVFGRYTEETEYGI
jgi:hypothetical protein